MFFKTLIKKNKKTFFKSMIRISSAQVITQYNKYNVRSRYGPGDAYFIFIHQVSPPVNYQYFAT